MQVRLHQDPPQSNHHPFIERWLDDRQIMLVSFCELAGLAPFEHKRHAVPASNEIQFFCQRLVDYISTGHFEVMARLNNQSGPVPERLKLLAQQSSDQLNPSTDLALQFNDHYGEGQALNNLAEFHAQLSDLGQALEQRFALEDALIQHWHQLS